MRMSDADLLIVPDHRGLSPDDWQNRWLSRMKTTKLVAQVNWKKPDRTQWVAALEAHIEACTRPVILVGHGLGVATIIHAAQKPLPACVVGAILVAPRQIGQGHKFASFAPLPSSKLQFPSMLIAAQNNPLCPIEQAKKMAKDWGSEFHDAGQSAHINAASGQGIWPEGMMVLSRLLNIL